jgi:predicted ATP-grasp superfamily ATP-dependent carboligase
MSNFIVVGKSGQIVVAVLRAIRSFTDAGTVVIGDHETDPLRWSSLCSRKLDVRFDGSDDIRFVELVNGMAKNMPHLKLIPADCEGIRITNRVRGRLDLNIAPVPDAHTLEMFDNKWLFHQFCMEHGLRVPMTRFVGAKQELDFDAVSSELGLPFVIKPTNQAGSLGVQIVHSKEFFEESILGNPAYDFSPLIAQRYIDGIDIDLSLLSVNGRLSAYAIQQAAAGTISFVSNAYLENVAVRLCGDSSYHGVMHVDARIEKRTGKVFLIESNPRFWASVTASVWCGLNFVAESVEHTPRPHGPRRLTSGSAVMRHPLVQPASWPSMLTDQYARGRLLRATTFDIYSLAEFARNLPGMFWKFAKKQNAQRAKAPALGRL